MSSGDLLSRILECGIVAVMRSARPEPLIQAADALVDGGVEVLEVTFTVPQATAVLTELRKRVSPAVILGAGTVLDTETARIALLAGAQFLVTPTVHIDVIQLCRRYGAPVFAGALTPTEVLRAWEAGADVVKIFPADLGGPNYLRALRGPLPQVRLMPTGGVDLHTARPFLEAGACALGVGGSLVSAGDLESGNMTDVRRKAAEFRDIVRKFRAGG